MSRYEEIVGRESEERIAGADRKFFGRSEHVTTERGAQRMMWAVYEGEEREGYAGKEPIAYLTVPEDIRKFLIHAEKPTGGKKKS